MPAHSLNPGYPPRFDARAAIRTLRRVVLLAPPLAMLLVLAPAGAASAADGPDLVDAATTAPGTITAELKPAKEGVVQIAAETVQSEPAQAALTIVRGARDDVDSVVGPVAPVPIPPVVLPYPFEAPDRGVAPRRPDARGAALTPSPAELSSGAAVFIADQPTADAAQAQNLDGSVLLRPMEPLLPLGPIVTGDDVSIGGSGFGPSPWLGQASSPAAGLAWRSLVRYPTPSAIPRGLTPRSLVPPG